MNIVTAIDSFKGSLSSLEAGEAAREGFLRAIPGVSVAVRPLADGGEGTMEALTLGMGGKFRRISVTGPLGEPVDCRYGIIEENGTAVVEMAEAAGLTLVPAEKRDPLAATTYGVGEIIRDAIGQGCRRFLVGIGGSATNDGGLGMLEALGFELLDAEGNPAPPGAAGLEKLTAIRGEKVLPELSECAFRVACDVENPLCGEFGCSAVFGPQKGADPEMVRQMDQWMERYARLAETVSPKADRKQAGAGAAGGLGFAFLAFTNAVLEPGIRIVLEETHLEEWIRGADLVVTGEGRLDGQTVMGKAPVGVARMARKLGIPVIALAGSVSPEAAACNDAGIDAYFPILREAVSLEEAMKPEIARRNLAEAAEQVGRLVKAAAGKNWSF